LIFNGIFRAQTCDIMQWYMYAV